jgi:predicted CopG family antitoxin
MNEQRKLRELINLTHRHGVEVARKIAEATRLKQALEKLNAERRAHLKQLEQKSSPSDFTMYDTTTVGSVPNWVPSRPFAVAGYVGGKWPTYNALVKRFTKARHLSIAVNAQEDANCLDVEAGDASVSEVVGWVLRQKRLGKKRIILYFSVSKLAEVVNELNKAGINRNNVKFWGAHYTFQPHIEPGFDAIQWTDKALGKNLDASLCRGDFLTP